MITKQTSKGGDKKGVLESLQVQSTRDAAPAKFSGDATAHVQVDGDADRTGNKWTGYVVYVSTTWWFVEGSPFPPPPLPPPPPSQHRACQGADAHPVDHSH